MEAKFCEKCGAGLEGQPTTCPRCGQPLQKKGMSTCAIIGIVAGVLAIVGFFVIAILAAILVPNFLRAKAQGQYTACKSNLKNLGTALEMWSTDNQGYYPDTLGAVTPNYLKVMPTCPAAQSDTYSSTYTSTKRDEAQGTQDSYSLYCSGSYHTSISTQPNYPQYNSVQGLID